MVAIVLPDLLSLECHRPLNTVRMARHSRRQRPGHDAWLGLAVELNGVDAWHGISLHHRAELANASIWMGLDQAHAIPFYKMMLHLLFSFEQY